MKRTIQRIAASSLSCVALALTAHLAHGQDAPPPTKEQVKYSPYPSKSFPNNVYFGDTHLHTSYSTDAGMTGTTLGPEVRFGPRRMTVGLMQSCYRSQ
jgi:hypothetical protein